MKSSPDGSTGFRKTRPQTMPSFFLSFVKQSVIITELSRAEGKATVSPAVELKSNRLYQRLNVGRKQTTEPSDAKPADILKLQSFQTSART